jgi:hypothetical protein
MQFRARYMAETRAIAENGNKYNRQVHQYNVCTGAIGAALS